MSILDTTIRETNSYGNLNYEFGKAIGPSKRITTLTERYK